MHELLTKRKFFAVIGVTVNSLRFHLQFGKSSIELQNVQVSSDESEF